jgi:hypothetical protein
MSLLTAKTINTHIKRIAPSGIRIERIIRIMLMTVSPVETAALPSPPVNPVDAPLVRVVAV